MNYSLRRPADGQFLNYLLNESSAKRAYEVGYMVLLYSPEKNLHYISQI